MANINCIKPNKCQPTEPEKVIHPPETPPFSFCAGNKTITWDGSRLRKIDLPAIPDGEYGTVSVVNGCIVGYGQEPVPAYTPPYCNPNPAPCGEGSGGDSGYTISPEAGNTLEQTALGLYGKTFLQGSATATVTGSGTRENPYKVTNAAGSGITNVVSDNLHITVEETTPGTASISLEDSGIPAGTYAGFSVDRFGFITGYSDTSDDVVNNINPGDDITVSNVGGTYTVGHPTQAAGNTTVRLGAFDVRITSGGHIESTTRQTTVTPGVYAVDGWLLAIDAFGSVTSMEEDPSPGPSPSLAIIDIIDVTFRGDTNTYSIQGLGAQQPTNASGNADLYTFTMPSYVTSESQVTTIGGGGLYIVFTEGGPLKVQMTPAGVTGASVKFVIRGV